MTKHHLSLLVLVSGLMASCSRTPEPQASESRFSPVMRSASSRALMAHGLSVGDVVRAAPLECTPGPAASDSATAIHIVTFATPYDCALCNLHLSGMQALASSGQLPAGARLVVWAAEPRAIARRFRKDGAIAPQVCVDPAGALWDAHDLSHTPFTAVLRGREVLYLHDQPLQTIEERAQFLADLADLSGQAFPPTGEPRVVGADPRSGRR